MHQFEKIVDIPDPEDDDTEREQEHRPTDGRQETPEIQSVRGRVAYPDLVLKIWSDPEPVVEIM